MTHVLLVVSAADDKIINPGKSGLAVWNSSVHVSLEGRPRIPQTKRHPLILEQAVVGVVMVVFCTSSGLGSGGTPSSG